MIPGAHLLLAKHGRPSGGWGDGPAGRRRVLIVEDDASTRRVLAALLELRGYEVVQAGDARSGLEISLQMGVDLIVSDLQLPGLSGIELAAAVTRRDGHPPMIAVTSGPDALVGRARESGCFESVLRKPIDVERLLDLADELTAGGSR